MSVLIETTVGDLVFDLYTDERPRSTLNFIKLCKIKYYNYCLFHSVRRNFIAQSGDPTGTGRGGESIYSLLYGTQAKYFDLETKPRIKHKTKGTISFVNNGNDKHGSQFFITMGEALDFLDGKHTIFGALAEGFDTLEAINETICDDNHKPFRDVRITHTIILYDPFEDPAGLTIPDRSPEPTEEQLESGRIAADEEIDDKGRSKEDVQKEIEDKELQIGTKILETVGDIKEETEKPPENVLFVCKLNPITKAEDLKIIFSRFGKIASCEIIKDHKTGESLCYGFVEFKEVEACEKAYFKMDNVLIDDRRIHVDFCQTIGKTKKALMMGKGGIPPSLKSGKDSSKAGAVKEFELKDKSNKKDKEKYSLVFEEGGGGVDEEKMKPKKKEVIKEVKEKEKEKVKKKQESESEEEEKPVPKKSSEKKEVKERSKAALKEASRRRRSLSDSDSDEDTVEVKKKKKSDAIAREKSTSKKRYKKEKQVESDSDSDEEEHTIKKVKKKKSEQKKHGDGESGKKTHKKEKKHKPPPSDDSDSEEEKSHKAKSKRKKSESESDEPEQKVKKKVKKEKLSEKKKKKKHESEEDTPVKHSKTSKQKGLLKKKNKAKMKTKHHSESDDSDDEPEQRKKKKKVVPEPTSSDDSSEEEERKKPSKKSSSKNQDSSDDDRKKRSKKKAGVKKKVRKRNDTSDSDSSDD